jgi:hypothetical protein
MDRTVVPVMPVTAAPPIVVPAAQAPVRRATAAERHRPGGAHLLHQARVHPAELPAPPTADREGTAGRLRSAGVRPHARVTSHGGQAAPGRAAPDRVLGLPAAPARTASPAGRLGPRPATGRDDPYQAAIRGAAPGPGALRAGPPMVRAHVAEVLPVPTTADPPRAAEPAVPASLVQRVPPAVATRARVLRGRARTARAGTTPTGARPVHVALDPVATAGRIGRSANAATPPRGRRVTGRPDPPATATGPHGRHAPATVTAPAITTAPAAATVPRAVTVLAAATMPGAVTIPGAVTVPAVASAPGAASGAGAVAGSAPADAPGAETASGPAADGPGPRETRHRPGRHARPGRSFQTPSRPSSSNPRPVPS